MRESKCDGFNAVNTEMEQMGWVRSNGVKKGASFLSSVGGGKKEGGGVGKWKGKNVAGEVVIKGKRGGEGSRFTPFHNEDRCVGAKSRLNS